MENTKKKINNKIKKNYNKENVFLLFVFCKKQLGLDKFFVKLIHDKSAATSLFLKN